jgi:hypothetical protein
MDMKISLSIAKSIKSLIGEFMCDMFIFNLVDKSIALYDTVICAMSFLLTIYLEIFYHFYLIF